MQKIAYFKFYFIHSFQILSFRPQIGQQRNLIFAVGVIFIFCSILFSAKHSFVQLSTNFYKKWICYVKLSILQNLFYYFFRFFDFLMGFWPPGCFEALFRHKVKWHSSHGHGCGPNRGRKYLFLVQTD